MAGFNDVSLEGALLGDMTPFESCKLIRPYQALKGAKGERNNPCGLCSANDKNCRLANGRVTPQISLLTD